MKKLTAGLAAIAVSTLFASAEANAMMYDFTFTTTVATANTPGIKVGDVLTMNVFADNGNSTLNSQTWTASNVSYFTIKAGSYSATYSSVYAFNPYVFQTGASGNLTSVLFSGTNAGSTNTDNFGTWVSAGFPPAVNGNLVFTDFNGRQNFIPVGGADNVNQWSVAIAPAPTPLPSTLSSMVILGLCSAGFLAYRRRKQHNQLAIA